MDFNDQLRRLTALLKDFEKEGANDAAIDLLLSTAGRPYRQEMTNLLSNAGSGLWLPEPSHDVKIVAQLLGQRGGQIGGRATSEAKKKASRENGKLGGRPRKQQAQYIEKENQSEN